jgi:riboflavin kinase
MRCVKIVGKVFSGIGEGRKYVELYRNEIRKALGIDPYPGTLNIRLEPAYIAVVREVLNSRPYTVIAPPNPALGPVLVWKGFIKSMQVFIVKPVRTVWGVDVIEVISEDCLRCRLSLVDGDIVSLLVALEPNAICTDEETSW